SQQKVLEGPCRLRLGRVLMPQVQVIDDANILAVDCHQGPGSHCRDQILGRAISRGDRDAKHGEVFLAQHPARRHRRSVPTALRGTCWKGARSHGGTPYIPKVSAIVGSEEKTTTGKKNPHRAEWYGRASWPRASAVMSRRTSTGNRDLTG